LQALEMTPAHKEAMLRGIGLAIAGNDLPYDPQQIQAQLQDFLGKRQASFLTKIKAAQVAAGNEHFAKIKADKNVTELPSGLRYEIVTPGKGAVAKPGQAISIHYTGSLAGGQVFDSSVQRGQPAEFILNLASAQNPNGVIAGMFEGLQKTGVGGKLKLHIPPSLAYGDEGAPGAIPPGATLIFDIEILEVKDAPKEPAK
jgi:FKBP-type peptidyl-prolyl cis-trans isomerase FkpA